ncbi:MAG: hypothetical protein GXO69_04390 [Acidobacteria bacterium]|nr:hypothetical protein [Acidobacteriota bacterium]
MMKFLKRTDILLFIYGCQWFALFLIPNAAADYFLVGMTFFFILTAPRPWFFVVLQFAFILVAPPAVFRAVLFGVLFLLLRDNKIPFRVSVVLLVFFFFFLARYAGFRIPVVFPGVLAIGALIYAVSRVKGLAVVLAPSLSVYCIVSLIYVFFYLFWEHAYRFQPVFAIPLDLIQLTTAAVLFCTVRSGGCGGIERNAAPGTESIDAGPGT